MNWFIEVAKLLGYALVTSLVYVFLDSMRGINNSKATGWAALRAEGYPVMLIGLFTVILGFVLSRLDLVVSDSGHLHLTLR